MNRQLVYRCEAKVGRSSWYCLVMYWGLNISPSLLALQNFPFCHQSSSDDRRHLQTVVRCRDLKWSNKRRTCDENDFQKESAPGARTLGPGAGTPAPRVNGARTPTLGVGNPILGARTPVQRAWALVARTTTPGAGTPTSGESSGAYCLRSWGQKCQIAHPKCYL